jgi:PAB1-binding protein PBP1
MSEILFIFTIIFGAYVICVVTSSNKKTTIKSTLPEAESKKSAVATVSLELSRSEPELPKKTPSRQTTITELTTAKTKMNNSKKGLKNPETGEIATTYTNYRFTKRWIKEALVSEGLLEKVYKNNELNPETEAAIKAAIARLETIESYKAYI